MTTEERTVDEAAAHAALTELAKIERARDRQLQVVADSLGLRDPKALEKHIDALKVDIKQYLIERGGELHDGEAGVTARIQERSTPATYDLVTCARTAAGQNALADAASAGMLRLDDKMLERFRGSAGAGWADLLYGYRMPGGATYALLFERVGR